MKRICQLLLGLSCAVQASGCQEANPAYLGLADGGRLDGPKTDRPADTPLSGADAPGERADVYVIRAPDVSADRASATDYPRVGTEVGQGREVLPDGLGGVSDITGPNVDVPGVDEAESGDGPGSEYAGEVAGPADAQCDACDDATWGAWLDGQEAGDAARDMEDRGGVLDGA